MHKLLFLLFFVVYIGKSSGKVTEKQYASMPDLFHMDNWDKCMQLEDEAFYCSFTYTVEPLDKTNLSDVYNIIQEVSSNRLNYNHTNLRHFLCMPWHCPEIQITDETDPNLPLALKQCYDKKFAHLGLRGEVSAIKCDTKDSYQRRYPIGVLEILVATFLILYIAFVLFSTFVEGVYRYKTEKEYEDFVTSPYGKLLATFSLTRNWIRLKTIKSTPDVEKLRGMQGIRVYNLFLVVLSHTILTFMAAPMSNPRFAETSTEQFMNIFMSSGPLCVSTFFQMSGFLLAMGMFDYFEGKKEVPPRFLWLAFLNRCIRLTPTLIIILALHATWLPHFSYGPFWDNIMGEEYRTCRKTWWTNLLYIQNYVYKTEMCMMQTWYICLDTQFFIVGLILIYFMKKNEKKIPLILGSCLGIHMIVTFVLNYIQDFDATIMPAPEIFYLIRLPHQEQWHSQLLAFHGNVPGLVVGMAYGYAYHKYRNTQLFTSKLRVAFWWVTVLLLPLGIIIFPGLIIYNPTTQKNIFWASVYVATCRTVFTVGIGFVMFGFTQGIGWIAKRISEWPPTYILGRITYSTYLVHVTMLKIRPALMRSPVYVNEFFILYNVLADFTIAFIMGTILTLFVEMPISELQKLLIPQKGDKEKVTDKEPKKVK